MESVSASTLVRNDQVVVSEDELPYLVDKVVDMPNDRVQVTYSSGDIVEYAHDQEVLIR